MQPLWIFLRLKYIVTRAVMAFLFLWLLPLSSHAFFDLQSVPLGGYAWSSNIGWIAMSGAAHNVTVNTDGTLSGYAWSSNIGWIRFGGLSGFPTGGGTVAQNANLVETAPGSLNYELRGWARACAGAANVASCSGGAHPDAGGWDGWIALSGTDHGISLSAVGAATNSYAWGGTVIGWVDFSRIEINAVVNPIEVKWNRETVGNHIPSVDPMRDWVQFSVVVTGGLATGTIPYTLTVDGHTDTVTGMYDFATGAFSNPLRIDDVLAGVPQTARLTIGGSEFTDTFTLPVEPPIIRIIPAQSLLRQGDATTITVRIDPDYYQVTCDVRGAGINDTFTSTYTGGRFEESMTTSPIRNQTRITVTCLNTLGTPIYTATTDIQVIPTFQEF